MATQERKEPKRRGASFSELEVDLLVAAVVYHNSQSPKDSAFQIERRHLLAKLKRMQDSF